MILKKLLFPIILLATTVWFAHHRLTQITEHPTSLDELGRASNIAQPTAILVCMLPGSGGTERYTLAQQQEFIKQGVPTIIICNEHGFLAKQCAARGLPHITCSHRRWQLGGWIMMPGVEAALKRVLKQDVLAIHCSHRHEALVARKVVGNIPIVLTQHMGGTLASLYRNVVDAVVAVGRGPGTILLPPLFDAARITAFIPPTTDAATFFKAQFNIALKPCPLLVKIAHLYSNVQHKNHPLLFKAMHDLIIKHNIPVQVALVGDGPACKAYKKMVAELGISDYIHFIGSTELTPAVLHYADINILTSSKEAFGIVLLEGGLMKKPTIVARGGCGAADWLIIDKQTGFLFENNDAQSLADTIAYAIAHEDEAKVCGERLYEKVVAEFMPHQTAARLLELYREFKIIRSGA